MASAPGPISSRSHPAPSPGLFSSNTTIARLSSSRVWDAQLLLHLTKRLELPLFAYPRINQEYGYLFCLRNKVVRVRFVVVKLFLPNRLHELIHLPKLLIYAKSAIVLVSFPQSPYHSSCQSFQHPSSPQSTRHPPVSEHKVATRSKSQSTNTSALSTCNLNAHKKPYNMHRVLNTPVRPKLTLHILIPQQAHLPRQELSMRPQ